MGTLQFRPATKRQSRLRMGLAGPSKSGKTYTGLTCAHVMAGPGGKVAVIDSERGSASKYADRFPPYDTLELTSFHPQRYIDAIHAAEDAGYASILADSLSHAWEGQGGALELHDDAVRKQRSGNSWTAWREVTPLHQALVDAMLQSPCHIIATMRSRTEYIQTEDEKGKAVIRKVGMAPIQRPGIEYEFDLLAEMDVEHVMVVSGSRCPEVDGAVVKRPDAAWFETIKRWLEDGAPTATAVASDPPLEVAPEALTAAEFSDLERWTTALRGLFAPAITANEGLYRLAFELDGRPSRPLSEAKVALFRVAAGSYVEKVATARGIPLEGRDPLAWAQGHAADRTLAGMKQALDAWLEAPEGAI